MALFHFDLVSGFGDSRSVWLSVALLAIAGGYQFSALKEACLSKCRAPLTFFMQHWGESPLSMGLRLGATCLGCCWALMLLAFVGGVMSLAFMGLATLIMTLEKLPDIGRWLSRPLGVALLGGAGLDGAYRILKGENDHGTGWRDRNRPLDDEGRTDPQLQLHGVLPLRGLAGQAPADRRPLPDLGRYAHRRGPVRRRRSCPA